MDYSRQQELPEGEVLMTGNMESYGGRVGSTLWMALCVFAHRMDVLALVVGLPLLLPCLVVWMAAELVVRFDPETLLRHYTSIVVPVAVAIVLTCLGCYFLSKAAAMWITACHLAMMNADESLRSANHNELDISTRGGFPVAQTLLQERCTRLWRSGCRSLCSMFFSGLLVLAVLAVIPFAYIKMVGFHPFGGHGSSSSSSDGNVDETMNWSIFANQLTTGVVGLAYLLGLSRMIASTLLIYPLLVLQGEGLFVFTKARTLAKGHHVHLWICILALGFCEQVAWACGLNLLLFTDAGKILTLVLLPSTVFVMLMPLLVFSPLQSILTTLLYYHTLSQEQGVPISRLALDHVTALWDEIEPPAPIALNASASEDESRTPLLAAAAELEPNASADHEVV